MSQPVFTSSRSGADEARLLYVYRSAGYDILHFPDLADFYVNTSHVFCHLRNLEKRFMVEFHLLGPVLSYWLERQNLLALHCSSVVVDGQAVGFLANSGGGKSSLAAGFVRAGHALLTDDLLPVECTPAGVVGRPGYPQMRLWPAEAQHFLGRSHDLAPIYAGCEKRRVPVGTGEFGTFCETSQPLRCLYLPARRDPAPGGEEIEIVPLSAQSALVELVRCSYTPRLAETLFQPRRMGVLARVARYVPMRRLYYPGGLDLLPAVQDAVLADLDGLPDRVPDQLPN